MERKYLKSPIKTARFSRLIAKAIDMFIVFMLTIFIYPFGLLIALFYISFADSLQKGQSVGKKIMGFSVISLEDGTPCSIKQSFIRNLMFSIPLFFSILPIWGWILTFCVGMAFTSLEIYFLFKLDSANRLGDVMADTTVVAPTGKLEVETEKSDAWLNQTGQTL